MSSQLDEMQAIRLMSEAMDSIMVDGDYAKGLRLFDEALKYDSYSGDIYHNRGMAYSHMQNWRQALEDFTRAIKLSPHPSSYEQRGKVYYRMGDSQAARHDWEQASRMDPNRSTSLMNLGWLCVEEQRFHDAIDYYTRAIDAEPTYAVAYAHRAKIYYDLGDKARAFEDFQHARDLIESGADTSDQDTMN